ncbi:3'(2'),5'-bisphosphate nucleotidase CysQ [Deinococcus sp. Arct2-2]|uniref:3'(2'),5'-bisphosphate nucleotidase CysQ family protein n=1 Tax=Deinococcus sp. Arct2-2 TaxID=2568653 RepID=UPI0010A3B0B2|nr:3'(2'),5'-bisphosphate nucleotidase CysQ [Deinococcus sp. Arct2-2]THF70564.1 3'(2'),5'-bisphosphate nucleotidase CysQ [Deinococcus sp. Arct2-2]
MPPLPPAKLQQELDTAIQLAREAGALLLSHLARGLIVEYKTSAEDTVTAADREASALIVAGLKAAFPGDGLLSEEETDSPENKAERLGRERVWIVDPIDGTNDFVKGTADFSVSIGLAVGGEPVLGVVFAPASGELFAGMVGAGVTKNGERISVSTRSGGTNDPFIVAISGTEYKRELHLHDLPGMKPSGSIALKLARIAAGEADATFTMSPRSEWDIAAGHALLRASGGDLLRRDGLPIRYNQPSPHIEQGIVGGRPEALAWLTAELAARALPTAHLGLEESALAWATLPGADQAALAGHLGVNVRHGGGQTLALLVVDPATRTVERAEGDAFHLSRLTRDVVRAIGALNEQPHGPHGG